MATLDHQTPDLRAFLVSGPLSTVADYTTVPSHKTWSNRAQGPGRPRAPPPRGKPRGAFTIPGEGPKMGPRAPWVIFYAIGFVKRKTDQGVDFLFSYLSMVLVRIQFDSIV